MLSGVSKILGKPNLHKYPSTDAQALSPALGQILLVLLKLIFVIAALVATALRIALIDPSSRLMLLSVTFKIRNTAEIVAVCCTDRKRARSSLDLGMARPIGGYHAWYWVGSGAGRYSNCWGNGRLVIVAKPRSDYVGVVIVESVIVRHIRDLDVGPNM